MILALSLALADPRRDGTAAEARMDFAAAVEAFRECAATAPDRDRRFCAARLAVLEPQVVDQFAGWTALERARRDPGSGEAVVRAALAANPSGPAAEALNLWLTHRALRTGDGVESDEAWVQEQVAMRDRRERHRWLGLAGLATGALYGARAAWGPGPWAWRGAVVAALVLGVVPLGLAAAYEPENALGFARSGAVLAACVLVAPRASPWFAGLGTLGALLWAASENGWLASMGLP